MEDESQQGATLIIRAWRAPTGDLAARITYGVDGQQPALEIANARSEAEVIAVVRDWVDSIRPAGGPNGPSARETGEAR